MQTIDPADFRLGAGKKADLDRWPTRVKPVYRSREEYQTLLTEHVSALSAQQSLLYASDSYALLLIFQAMDAAGKDSAIKHVMSGVNPQGCQVFSFKHPERGGSGSRFSLAHHAAICRSAAASGFSTAPTTRRC